MSQINFFQKRSEEPAGSKSERQAESRVLEFKSYQDMQEAALSCKDCDLCHTRNNVVISDGNPNAKLMLIGEGPGEHEDLQGVPFVGKAGKLLDKILDAANINRQEETYICNVVKCRPPNNRVPSEAEAEKCWKYLRYQIQAINPEIILLLGSTALKYALGLKNPRITKIHGQWYKEPIELADRVELFEGRLIMPFFHPSYLLRNASREPGSPKWKAWEAIKVVKTKLDSLN